MRSVNRVTILGRLVEKPEARAAGNKAVSNFFLETTESWMSRDGEQTRVVRHACTAFGPVAGTVDAAQVGDHIYVEGALRSDRNSDSNEAVEVVCFVAIPVEPQAGAAPKP